MRPLSLRGLVRRQLPSGPPGLLRIVFGVLAVIKLADLLPKLRRVVEPDLLRVPYFPDLPAPTPLWVTALGVLWLVGALFFTLGWGGAKPGVLLTVGLAGVLGLDRQLYSNHLYLLTLVVPLLTLGEAWRGRSLDARRGRGAASVPAWPYRLLQAQLSLVYLFAGLAKCNAVFLSGAVLAEQMPRFAQHGDWLRAASWLGLGVEIGLAFGLWHHRTRRATAGVGIGFHTLIFVFLQPKLELLVFGLASLALYLPFFLRPLAGEEAVS